MRLYRPHDVNCKHPSLKASVEKVLEKLPILVRQLKTIYMPLRFSSLTKFIFSLLTHCRFNSSV